MRYDNFLWYIVLLEMENYIRAFLDLRSLSAFECSEYRGNDET